MATLRQHMIALLSDDELGARELSQELHVTEKEVYTHLSHIARSLNAQKKRLVITPSSCLSCGYVFKERTRVTRPSRCPRCKSERIEEPAYRVAQR